MKKKKPLYIATVPAVSHEFASQLAKRFPTMEVKPGVTQEELLYNAGQRSVIDFVTRSATGTIISGDIDDLRPDPRGESLLTRILGVLR
jgi:hypothetical protein